MQRVPTLRLWLLAALAFAFSANTLLAQADSKARETALRFLRENPARFGLSAADVADVRVTDEYLTDHNGVTHVWVQQQYAGIPVFNGMFGLHVKPDGNVAYLAHRFVPGLAGKVNTTLPSLSATKALEMAMRHLGFADFSVPGLKTKINERNLVYAPGAISKRDIPVSICYQPLRDGTLRLAWQIVITQANTPDEWNLRVDAQTGEILDKNNRTVYCKLDHDHAADKVDLCSDQPATTGAQRPTSNQKAAAAADETYNVFALPVESPTFGARSILVNPANPIASPFGWLDQNGAAGPENTYSFGNNVWAFDDSANDDTGSAAESVNGGAALNFDFPFNINLEPDANHDAAVTNLFYMNNMMHDISYLYGFDEKAGNFQFNNYGNGGAGDDYVNANALDDYTAALTGSGGTNNANFGTPPDGFSPQMQMYVWNSTFAGKILTVNAPGGIAGYYDATGANFGAPITNTPVTGNVVLMNDGSGEPTLGCNSAVNNIAGKIVLIDRGTCTFLSKVTLAQASGAIGVIVANFEEATVTMGVPTGQSGAGINIPSVMVPKSIGDLLKQNIAAGLNVSLVQPPGVAGPDFLDGDFDNGIIAHEYGHGISNRLTGGPSNTDCLFNKEQMGEGWSDFFSLIVTAKPGDFAEKKRGLGTFVVRQDPTGDGIRRYPYSTNMILNPQTYANAQDDEEHNRGEIWAAVTWDLYWALAEKYGFDPDITNVNSGNGRAIQLVMDGMKLQPCGPGFIDGRDAIILADILNHNGEDTCLIYSVFARRGMGLNASQGSANSAIDGTENFDPVPTCIKELKIKKTTSDPLIEAGQDVHFDIAVTNDKDDPVTDVVVTDELPAGLTFVQASNAGTYSNGIITWNLGTLAHGQTITVHYVAASDPAIGSLRFYRDELETETDFITIWTEGDLAFSLQNDQVKTGTAAWRAESVATETDMTLEYLNTVTVAGAQPVLRFWHDYNTETGADGGFIEIRRAAETQWQRFPLSYSFRNPPRTMQYGTFAIPFLNAFSGNSNGWVQGYYDLSQYAGEEISYRFRFGTDDNTTVADGHWIVDDVEMMDMFNYDGQACVQSAQNDQACARAPERGVIVNPVGNVATHAPDQNSLAMLVQPNPASDLLHISVGQPLEGRVLVSLFGADGREVLHQSAEQGLASSQVLTLDVQQVPAGVYVVRLQSNAGSSVKTVVIR